MVIGAEILAGNALIEKMERKERRTVSIKVLEEYCKKFTDYYREKFNEEAIVLFCQSKIIDLTKYYSKYFEVKDDEISVKEDVTSGMLRDMFRGPLPYAVFQSLVSDEVLNNSILKNV